MNRVLVFSAKAIQYIFNPILIAVYSVGALLFASPNLSPNAFSIKFAAFKMVLLAILATPIAAIGLSRLTTKLISGEQSELFDRIITCSVLLFSYVSAIFILKPFFTYYVLVRLFVPPILLIVLWMFARWEQKQFSISLASAVAATTTLYMFAFLGVHNLNWVILSAIVVTGVIGSAAIVRGEDSAQLIFGAIYGFISAIFSFLLVGVIDMF